MSDKSKWERLADACSHPLHEGYSIHNLTVRQMNRFEKCVYNVNGKEKTLAQICQQEELFNEEILNKEAK